MNAKTASGYELCVSTGTSDDDGTDSDIYFSAKSNGSFTNEFRPGSGDSRDNYQRAMVDDFSISSSELSKPISSISHGKFRNSGKNRWKTGTVWLTENASSEVLTATVNANVENSSHEFSLSKLQPTGKGTNNNKELYSQFAVTVYTDPGGGSNDEVHIKLFDERDDVVHASEAIHIKKAFNDDWEGGTENTYLVITGPKLGEITRILLFKRGSNAWTPGWVRVKPAEAIGNPWESTFSIHDEFNKQSGKWAFTAKD